MRSILRMATALVVAAGLSAAASAPLLAQEVVYAAGDSTSGTYMDYMKTVYARAGNPEIIQLPLTALTRISS